MSNKFVGKLIGLNVVSDCATCQHKSIYLSTCDSYPYGIPEEILKGGVKHRTPWPGDNGLLYKPIKGGK